MGPGRPCALLVLPEGRELGHSASIFRCRAGWGGGLVLGGTWWPATWSQHAARPSGLQKAQCGWWSGSLHSVGSCLFWHQAPCPGCFKDVLLLEKVLKSCLRKLAFGSHLSLGLQKGQRLMNSAIQNDARPCTAGTQGQAAGCKLPAHADNGII